MAEAFAKVFSGGHSSTTALADSTEAAQFHQHEVGPHQQHGHDEGLVHNHDWAVHDREAIARRRGSRLSSAR